MNKIVSHRVFIIPLLVFVGFSCFFFWVEHSAFSHDKEMRHFFNDPLVNLVHDFQVAAWALNDVLDVSRDVESNAPLDAKELKAALIRIKHAESALSNYLVTDGMFTSKSTSEVTLLGRVRTYIQSMNDKVSNEETITSKQWADCDEILSVMMKDFHHFEVMEIAVRKERSKVLVEQVAVVEKQRAMLVVFVLVSGIAFVLVLLDSVYHYKSNAERAEAAEHYNAIFAAALQNTNVGVLIRDMKRKGNPVIFINNAFTKLTGYTYEDFVDERLGFLFGWNTDQTAIRSFHRALQLEESVTLDLMLYRKDGSPFWAEWHLSPLLGEEGKASYFVSIFNDTTSIRNTQEELIQAKQLAERASSIKTSFLAMMSHEIRTPINGILGVLRLLQESSLEDDQQHLLDVAMTSSNVLHGIINDILDYAKMEAGKIEIVDEVFAVRKLLGDLVALGKALVGSKPVELKLVVNDNVPDFLVGDPGRLRQIILNLVSNAIKFTDHGLVQVSVNALVQQEVDGKPGFLVRFDVQDTGLGISNEDQEKLFKEFSQIERSFTRKYGGTGLGLAICRRLVTLMRGEIGVESQVGFGSKFWFLLPMALGQEITSVADQNNDMPDERLSPSKINKILLVEDNETNRLVARKYLDKCGFSVVEAADGLQALNICKDDSFDLVLMDVSMPVMDGITATCHIRALGGAMASVPIIALTAHAMEGDRQMCLSSGMNDYLHKPLDYGAFVKCLERWLHISIEACLPVSPRNRRKTDQLVDEEAPIIDVQTLVRMKDNLGRDVVIEVIESYLDDSSKRILTLDSGDIGLIREVAHTLKSSSGNCGLKRLSIAMEKLEKAAVSADRFLVNELVSLVKQIHHESCSALRNERTVFSP